MRMYANTTSKALLKTNYNTFTASFASTRPAAVKKKTRFHLIPTNWCWLFHITLLLAGCLQMLFNKFISVAFWLLKAGQLFCNIYFVIKSVLQSTDYFYHSQSTPECLSSKSAIYNVNNMLCFSWTTSFSYDDKNLCSPSLLLCLDFCFFVPSAITIALQAHLVSLLCKRKQWGL